MVRRITFGYKLESGSDSSAIEMLCFVFSLVSIAFLLNVNASAPAVQEITFGEKDVVDLIHKLPADLQQFYENLSDEDIDALNKASEEINSTVKLTHSMTFDQAVGIIRKQSTTLADRVVKLNKDMMAKVESMGEPVQKFVDNVITKVTDMALSPGDSDMVEVVKTFQDIIKDALRLPDNAKVNVERSFPETRDLFESPLVLEGAKAFAQMTSDELKATVKKMGDDIADMKIDFNFDQNKN
ncbi:hypothetical protein L596_023257 [Steinernema carpocapsae]|uniref:Fatty-acid and retinol-binding protein 1 n=1 Tax=Steinernema carpocapsae TaxID=34508 RepID=A0A4U5MD33_STECR|nr:hypothetical protein L596_023257 [Steinernema carpocapsae]